METELGRIARLLGTAEAGRTPLQLRLAVFGKRLSLAVIYTPFGHRWFNTVALSGAELLACFAFAFTVFLAVEAEKALVRRGLPYRAGER